MAMNCPKCGLKIRTIECKGCGYKLSKSESKKNLEEKIVELEEKLTSLSNKLPSKRPGPSDLKRAGRRARMQTRMPPSPTHERLKEFERQYADQLARRNWTDPKVGGFMEYPPDHPMFETHSRIKEKQEDRGLLPKGFSDDPYPKHSQTYKNIFNKNKERAFRKLKEGKCLGCDTKLDPEHKYLCHECANSKLSQSEFEDVIAQFNKWGFYKKSIIQKIMLKLKLAEVK